MNYTQLQLKSKLISQNIHTTTLYYSLVKKDARTFSILSNQRLLIYDDNRRILFYINDFKNTPFKNNIPNPKKEEMPINQCTFANPSASNDLQVRYTAKNSNGELQTTEWNFQFEHKTVLLQWVQLLETEKNKLIEKQLGEKNAGFIHDTLMEGIRVGGATGKETILKPEEQVIKHVIFPDTEIRNSRITDPKRSNLQQSMLVPNSQSNINPQPLSHTEVRPNSNLRNIDNLGASNDKPNISTSNIRNSQINIRNSDLRNNDVRNSTVKPIGGGSNVYIPMASDIRERDDPKESNFNDWNRRFLENPNQATLHQFEEEAVRALMAIWSKDYNSLRDPRRVYESQGLILAVANLFTREAILLKREYRNYHFIMQASEKKLIVGVPLCCLVEWEGVVALVKAPLPEEAEQVRLSKVNIDIRELQRYTRVSNSCLEKGTLWDLTNLYGTNGDKRLIYVDGLVEYLPIHLQEEMEGTSVRPQFLLDSVEQVIAGGDSRASRQKQKSLMTAFEKFPSCLRELSSFLSSQELLWVDALQLKQIFHNFGINLKLLPKVYEMVSNKYVKKYLQTVMITKVAKDHLNDTLLLHRKDQSKVRTQKIVEDYLKLLMEGNNSNSSEIWKELSIKFKKIYSIPISISEIVPGFFLNSLTKLLRVRADVNRVNKSKKIFKEENIILDGFVVAVDPKVKTYTRFSSAFVQKIKVACREDKKDRDVYEEIVRQLQLHSRSIPKSYNLNNNFQAVIEYLTYYTPPPQLDPQAELKNIPIYDSKLSQPPSAFTLRITKSYLEWAIKKEKPEEFKKGVEEALKLSQFWLEDGHIFQTDLLQLLSEFYSSQGNYEESINFMKESLSKTIRICGSNSKAAGSKYYELGDKQLKAGHKKEALENFEKAKNNMEVNKTQSVKYPLILMRISSLLLNSGDIQGAIEQALHSIKQFDNYDKSTGNSTITEGYKVKTFEVLARAYEISGRKLELREMSLLCGKKFNKTKNEWAYEQMLRICLAAAIYNQPIQKCQFFQGLCSKLYKQEALDSVSALRDLMSLSDSFVVMEKFLARFESVERIAGEGASRKVVSQDSRDFLLVCKLLTSVVGEDYIEGLVQQKQYE